MSDEFAVAFFDAIRMRLKPEDDTTTALQFLESLSKVPRFHLTVAFLSRAQKQDLLDIFSWLESKGETYTTLRKSFGLDK
mmetsp:Transcript_1171/g.2332  ORF Transcript_1171/g.2332 Transcript_1171/m.2332 type:complete len:80 (+) Transcript_1171:198-437(+)